MIQLDDLSTMVLTNVDEFEENRESNHLQKQIHPHLLQLRKTSFNSFQHFLEEVHKVNMQIGHILSPNVRVSQSGEVQDWFSPSSSEFEIIDTWGIYKDMQAETQTVTQRDFVRISKVLKNLDEKEIPDFFVKLADVPEHATEMDR
eukprot:585136-Hanusia_phi.AAC.3